MWYHVDEITFHMIDHIHFFSPSSITNEPLTASFMKNYDDLDFGADFKLRGNGTLPHAIPNPYSTSELHV